MTFNQQTVQLLQSIADSVEEMNARLATVYPLQHELDESVDRLIASALAPSKKT